MIYNYNRELQNDGRYNINYSEEVVTLPLEIQDLFPTRIISMKCSGNIVELDISPDLSPTEKTDLDNLIINHKNNMSPIQSPFKVTGDYTDISNLDINLFGLYKEEIIDSFGLLIRVNYYKNYNGITYSDLYIKDSYVYNINAYDLVTDRTETITWYLEDNTIGKIKTLIKYYDTVSAIKEGVRRRSNLIDKAKTYGLVNIQGNHVVSGDPVMPNSHWFFIQIVDMINLYINGVNKSGLIDTINTSTESYLTQQIKDDLVNLLKYW